RRRQDQPAVVGLVPRPVAGRRALEGERRRRSSDRAFSRALPGRGSGLWCLRLSAAEEEVIIPQRGPFDTVARTTPLVRAPAAGSRIVVANFYFEATGGANSIQFKSAATVISSIITALAGQQFWFDAPQAMVPWLFCADHEALNLILTAATQVRGWMNY